MKKKTRYQTRRFTAVLMSAILLTGCAWPETIQTQPETGSSYETYSANELTHKNQFRQLEEEIFQDSLTQSALDLHFTLSAPEEWGVGEISQTFGQFSTETTVEDFEKLGKWKDQLDAISIRNLEEDQKLTYRILSEYLETELSAQGLELYSEPLSSTIGLQAQLPILLSEYAFYDRQDVENYLSLLSDIDRFYSQIIEFEKQKSEAGLFMCDQAARDVLSSCEPYLIQADHSFLSETFNTRIDALTDLTEEEKAAYKEENLKVLTDHFIPAYQLLMDGINGLMGTGTNDKGLCWYPKGKEYYEYLVRANICSSYNTIEDLKRAMEKQMSEDLNALGEIAASNPQLSDSLETYSFSSSDPTEILESLKTQITEDFPGLPQCNYTVKYVPKPLEGSLSPAFYFVPPIDQYEDNVIYINNDSPFHSEDLFPTLAHEGYPGHLYQNVYFIANNESSLRKILSFSSYTEGWATYVEHYSYTLDNGLEENMGELLAYNNAVSLGLYALLDVYIHYDGWGRDEVKSYLESFYGISGDDVVDSIYYSLVENPTNYMEYYVGYMEICQMRQTAEHVLGDNFSLKEFHTFLLDLGPAQFSVILPEFLSWLEDNRPD